MLSFEITEYDSLEIHIDSEGFNKFIQALQKVSDTEDHIHLMTEEWGGNELSGEIQGINNKLINHVKIINWK